MSRNIMISQTTQRTTTTSSSSSSSSSSSFVHSVSRRTSARASKGWKQYPLRLQNRAAEKKSNKSVTANIGKLSSSSSSSLVRALSERFEGAARDDSDSYEQFMPVIQEQRERENGKTTTTTTTTTNNDNNNNDIVINENNNKKKNSISKKEQRRQDLQSTDEEKLGRAAQYMRELIRKQMEQNDLKRVGSLTDSSVLRRKGRLKEQDALIEFMVEMHKTHTTEEVMHKVEGWIDETLQLPKERRKFTRLHKMVPQVGYFFHSLPLTKALKEYDEFSHLTKRQFVLPNFAEIRHILNIAQVHVSAKDVRLVTFDADGTLYQDGKHFEDDNKMIDKIIQLMELGIHVAIVTAAGYPGQPEKFEERTRGLLDQFKKQKLPPNVTKYFHVMGGECNYLLKINDEYCLEFVPNEQWATIEQYGWREGKDLQAFLDRAEVFLNRYSQYLGIDVEVMRKEYAVGIIPREDTIYENLEELALAAQAELSTSDIPFCAFNGGNDVFVDVGNKHIGLQALMKHLNVKGSQTLHVGDRFTLTGNDSKVRESASILWVANPDETTFFMRLLYRDILNARVL
jgi:IMP and pyridine-specific 5'-nucleotidase